MTNATFSQQRGLSVQAKGFHFPQLESLNLDRKQRFEEFCDTVDAITVQDHIHPLSDIRVGFLGEMAGIGLRDGTQLPIDMDSRFLGQLASYVGLSADQLNRQLASKDPAWTKIVNATLNQGIVNPLNDNDPDAKRMIRLLDGKASAFVSNSYLRIDNGPLKDWVRNLQRETRLVPLHWQMKHGDLTMQMIVPTGFNVAEARGGKRDDMFFGINVTNSMTGGATLTVGAFSLRRVCLNGMMRTVAEDMVRRRHLGSRIKQIGSVGYTQQEQEAMIDILRRSGQQAERLSSEAFIDAEVIRIQRAEDNQFERTLTESFVESVPVIRAGAKALGITQETMKDVLSNLFDEPTGGVVSGDYPTQWGFANAMTKAANGQDHNKAIELMGMGGRMLDMEPHRFNKMMSDLFFEFDRK